MELLKLEPNIIVTEDGFSLADYETIKNKIVDVSNKYKSLILTDENKQFLKEERSLLNKVSKQLNDVRISFEKEYTSPLNNLKAQVKELTDIIKETSNILDEQVKKQENEEKQQKENKLREYFTTLLEKENIDFLTFEDVGLNITLSASEKSLKERINEYISNVKSDLAVIDTHEQRIRLLAKYKINKSLSQSIIELTQELDKENEISPQHEDIDEEIITIDLTVSASKSKVKKLLEYLEREGIKYI